MFRKWPFFPHPPLPGHTSHLLSKAHRFLEITSSIAAMFYSSPGRNEWAATDDCDGQTDRKTGVAPKTTLRVATLQQQIHDHYVNAPLGDYVAASTQATLIETIESVKRCRLKFSPS